MQAVRLAWRAAASLSALELLLAGAGEVAAAGVGVAAGGVDAAHDHAPANAVRAIERATADTERMGEPRVDPTRITIGCGCADDATMKVA
jgi:hypothetical protein